MVYVWIAQRHYHKDVHRFTTNPEFANPIIWGSPYNGIHCSSAQLQRLSPYTVVTMPLASSAKPHTLQEQLASGRHRERRAIKLQWFQRHRRSVSILIRCSYNPLYWWPPS